MLHKMLSELPPSINAVNGLERQQQTKNVQEYINNNQQEINDEALTSINSELAQKNYLLSKSNDNKFILKDRSIARDSTYAERFKYFLQNTNDKAKCIEALLAFMNEVSQLNVFANRLNETGINFLELVLVME